MAHVCLCFYLTLNLVHYTTDFTLYMNYTFTHYTLSRYEFTQTLYTHFQVYVAANSHAKTLPVWTVTTLSAVLVGTLMLVVMGLAGYLSFRGATEGNILGIHA